MTHADGFRMQRSKHNSMLHYMHILHSVSASLVILTFLNARQLFFTIKTGQQIAHL